MKTPTTKQWIRAAADRVSLGSTRLITHHVGRFLRTAKSRVSSWPWWVQLIAAGVALKCGVPVLTALGDWAHRKATASRSGLFIAAALWLLSAYRVGHPDWKPKTTGEQGPDADPPQAEQPETAAEEPQPPFAPASISPTELVAAVRDVGTPNAQLVPLAEHLRVSTAAVRAAAAAVRWPVKDVRQDGRSSSAGLRWDDCPSPESTYPLSGVVGAGQSADDNDDSEEGQTRSGVRVKAIGLAGHSLFRRHNVESAREHATD